MHRTICQYLVGLKMYTAWDPAVLLLGTHPRQALTQVHKGFSKNVPDSIMEYSSAGQ